MVQDGSCIGRAMTFSLKEIKELVRSDLKEASKKYGIRCILIIKPKLPARLLIFLGGRIDFKMNHQDTRTLLSSACWSERIWNDSDDITFDPHAYAEHFTNDAKSCLRAFLLVVKKANWLRSDIPTNVIDKGMYLQFHFTEDNHGLRKT